MFVKPNYNQLLTRISTDLGVNPANIEEDVKVIYAKVNAKAFDSLYSYLDYISQQTNPQTADEEFLINWSNIYGVSRVLATQAQGEIKLTGSSGAQVLQGTIYQAANGQEYQVQKTTTLIDGYAIASIIAMSAGAQTNQQAATILEAVSSILGIHKKAEVISLTGGSNIETIDNFRSRVVSAFSTRVRFGTEADFVYWAKSSHSQVTNAWVTPHEGGLGSVVVRLICNDLLDRLPSDNIINITKNYIEQSCNIQARIICLAANPKKISIRVVLDEDTQANREEITHQLKELFLSAITKNSRITIVQIRNIIGLSSQLLSPLTDVVAVDNEVLVLNEVVYE